jgi:hypothetical protein
MRLWRMTNVARKPSACFSTKCTFSTIIFTMTTSQVLYLDNDTPWHPSIRAMRPTQADEEDILSISDLRQPPGCTLCLDVVGLICSTPITIGLIVLPRTNTHPDYKWNVFGYGMVAGYLKMVIRLRRITCADNN